MGVLEEIEKCVRREMPDELPVFCLSEQFDARYCEVPYEEYLTQPETVIRVQLEVIDKFGWDWAWVHLDDAMQFEALGVGVHANEDSPPVPCRYLDCTAETVENLQVPNPQTETRMPVVLDAISGLREAVGDDRCITGCVAGPFTALTHLFGLNATIEGMHENPDLLRKAMDFTTDLAIAWGLAQVDAGAHAIWIGDNNAATQRITAPVYKEWALDPTRQVVERLKEAGVYAFLFCDEENLVGLHLQAMTGPSALGMSPGLDLADANNELGEHVCLMGNIDPVGLLTRASASQVAGEADRQVRMMATQGMLLNTGGPVPPNAKGPNMHTMHDTGKKVWDLVHGRR